MGRAAHLQRQHAIPCVAVAATGVQLHKPEQRDAQRVEGYHQRPHLQLQTAARHMLNKTTQPYKALHAWLDVPSPVSQPLCSLILSFHLHSSEAKGWRAYLLR